MLRSTSLLFNTIWSTHKHNDAGERVFKVGAQGETVYVNQFYVIRNGQVASKHIFGGSQRLVSKLASQPVDAPSITGGDTTDPAAAEDPEPEPAAAGGNGNGNGGTNPNAGGANGAANGQGSGAGGVNAGGNGNGNGAGGGTTDATTNPPQEERDFYFYHPDHLGSSSYVTDIDGEVFQHVEYFPFGETWVEEHSNRQRTPYLFTGKELDEDTQLYYFGARYYDPRTSVWQSPDPILASYLVGGGNSGGVYQPSNLGLFTYSHNRPVLMVDPDGRDSFCSGPCGSNPLYVGGWLQEFSDAAVRYPSADPAGLGGPVGQYGLATQGTVFHGSAGQVRTRAELLAWVAQNNHGDAWIAAALGGLKEGVMTPAEAMNMANSGSVGNPQIGQGLHTVPRTRFSLPRNLSLDDLSAAASAPDRNGLTRAGRAVQKHGSRPGSAFPRATGNPDRINSLGQDIVDEILTHPGSVTKHGSNGRYGNYFDITAPDGRGLRYGEQGNFIGFLEP